MAYPQPPQYQVEGHYQPLLAHPQQYAPLTDVNAPVAPQSQGVVVVVQHPVPMMAINSAAGVAPVVPAPQPQVMADGLVPRAFDHPIADTYTPHAIGVVHKQPLSDSWVHFQANPLCAPCALMSGNICMALRQLTGQSICDYICWETKLKPRSYAAVHENRIEFNYATTECCGICIRDTTSVAYFDQIGDLQQATCCTPFHCCYCIECSGGVMARAPCSSVNCALCPCCRTYYPGLSDAKAFEHAYKGASAALNNKQRLVRMTRH